MVIGWPVGVNTVILDSTNGTVGETGVKELNTDNGLTERRLTTFITPRSYNVTMDFDWAEKDENGLSEFDRFEQWFAYRHQSGSNPFWFDSISKFNVNGSLKDSDGRPVQCQYVIAKGYQFTKSGYSMRVTMTWKEVYSGIVSYEEPDPILDFINAENGYITVFYTNKLSEIPTLTAHNFYYISLADKSKDPNKISDYTKIEPFRVVISNKAAIFSVKTLTPGTYKIICDYEKYNFLKNVVVTYK